MSKAIPLWNRHGVVIAQAFVDDGDFDAVSKLRWTRHSRGYAVSHGGDTLMHRMVLGLAKGDRRQGDHIDRDRLNNRRSNLRTANGAREQAQNQAGRRGSRSKYRGVTWCAQTGRWLAQATLVGKHVTIGRYDDEIEAARAAEEWRQEHMPFARPDPALEAV